MSTTPARVPVSDFDGTTTHTTSTSGLQVGVATYMMGGIQGKNTAKFATPFNATSFWNVIADDPRPARCFR